MPLLRWILPHTGKSALRPPASESFFVQQELRCLKRRRILPISNWETDEVHVKLESEANVVALCVGSFKRKTSPQGLFDPG